HPARWARGPVGRFSQGKNRVCGTMSAETERSSMSAMQGRGEGAPAGQIARALAVLEAVAEHGSSTARGISEATGIPLPTVYRIAQELIRSQYLVHLRDEQRFSLGYQLHRLAVGLHTELGIPRAVRE